MSYGHLDFRPQLLDMFLFNRPMRRKTRLKGGIFLLLKISGKMVPVIRGVRE